MRYIDFINKYNFRLSHMTEAELSQRFNTSISVIESYPLGDIFKIHPTAKRQIEGYIYQKLHGNIAYSLRYYRRELGELTTGVYGKNHRYNEMREELRLIINNLERLENENK